VGIAAAMWAVGYELEQLVGWVPALLAAALTFPVLAALFRLFTPEEIVLIRSGLVKARNKIPGLRRAATGPQREATQSS
jgi:hypothetical protein